MVRVVEMGLAVLRVQAQRRGPVEAQVQAGRQAPAARRGRVAAAVRRVRQELLGVMVSMVHQELLLPTGMELLQVQLHKWLQLQIHQQQLHIQTMNIVMVLFSVVHKLLFNILVFMK